MTERDLTTLLRDHVRDGEPPLRLSAGTVILEGRRAVRRTRARRAAAGLAGTALLGGAAAAVLPVVTGDGGGGTTRGVEAGVDPGTQQALADYDATAMPGVLFRAVGPVLNRHAPDIVDARAFTATDDQGTPLQQQAWGTASAMELAFGGDGPHRARVELMHARSEAEGDVRESCASDLSSGYAFSCEVLTVDGDLVTVRVTAVRAWEQEIGAGGWSTVTRQELRTGQPVAGSPDRRPIDPDEVYFLRTVESVHSETFLSVAQETVKAPTLAAAQDAFTLPVDALVDVVTDPTLVIPPPPG